MGFVDMGADDVGIFSFCEPAGKLLAQPVRFLRRDLTGDKGLTQVIGNDIILAAYSAGLLNVLFLGQQKFGVCHPAVTLKAGDKPSMIGLFRIFYIVDDGADCLPNRAPLAGMQRHDSCGRHKCLPS